MILRSGGEPTVMVHAERKIKRKRRGTISIVTEPEGKRQTRCHF